MAKRGLIVLAVALFVSGAAAAPAKPKRMMSLNLCADQLVLQLLPRERITSVSFLSLSSQNAYLTAEAAHVPVNYGTLEEVFAEKPDLVIAGTASTPTTRALLARAQIPLIQVPLAENFDAIRSVTRTVSRAVGEEAKGEALLQHMDATLAELAQTQPQQRIVIAGWESAGEVPGRGTLFDAILTAAGGINVAATAGSRLGAYDIEQLIVAKPDILAFGSAAAAQPGLRSEQLRHPLVRKLYAGHQITYPETLYACGLPQSADAAKELRRVMLEAMARPKP
jgi:iron complex transport system substrate-binding protein